jgi:hypothetical protein
MVAIGLDLQGGVLQMELLGEHGARLLEHDLRINACRDREV